MYKLARQRTFFLPRLRGSDTHMQGHAQLVRELLQGVYRADATVGFAADPLEAVHPISQQEQTHRLAAAHEQLSPAPAHGEVHSAVEARKDISAEVNACMRPELEALKVLMQHEEQRVRNHNQLNQIEEEHFKEIATACQSALSSAIGATAHAISADDVREAYNLIHRHTAAPPQYIANRRPVPPQHVVDEAFAQAWTTVFTKVQNINGTPDSFQRKWNDLMIEIPEIGAVLNQTIHRSTHP